MEIGPIFRALMHNKSRFWLIALEVALTLAVVANCVNLMLNMRHEFLRPSGLDEGNTLVVITEPFSDDFQDEDFVIDTERRDLEVIRSFPGVVAAAGMHALPLSGGGSVTSRRPMGSELDPLPAPYYVVTDGALEALDVELVEGRDFEPSDFPDPRAEVDERNVILTRAMAEAFFPDGSAVGARLSDDEGEAVDTVVGVIDHLHNSWPTWERGAWVMLRPGQPGSTRRMRYLVRTEAAAFDQVYRGIEEEVRAVHPGRIVRLMTVEEIKRGTFSSSLALIQILGAVIVLLVFVTSLGIIGLTSFSVTQRTRQIGTRRALGATKADIVRYFLVENAMITGSGLVLGSGLTLGLNRALVHLADSPSMDPTLLLAGVLGIWALGVLAALAPALRATAVAPEVATRTV